MARTNVRHLQTVVKTASTIIQLVFLLSMLANWLTYKRATEQYIYSPPGHLGLVSFLLFGAFFAVAPFLLINKSISSDAFWCVCGAMFIVQNLYSIKRRLAKRTREANTISQEYQG